MKYVRLKRGDIISYDENADDLDKPMIIHYPSEIVKESDTVKELFDAYIIDANYKDTPFLYDRNEPVDSPEFDNEDEVVYGAIWVRGKHGEPILKPVAKLNKKRKWELL